MTNNRTANVGAGAAGMRYLAAFAGGDNALIDTLKRPDLERRRLATIGAAMHIPAVFAGAGFGYGVSYSVGLIAAIGIGLVMAAAVLVVEAVIVRTLGNKSKPFVAGARLLLAATVGLIASQGPLMLLFQDRVETELAEQHRNRTAQIRGDLDEEREAARDRLEADREAAQANAQARTDTIQGAVTPVRVEFDDDLEELLEDRDCHTRWLANEQSGIAQTLPCGTSSGIPECGARCESIRALLDAINRDIERVRQARTDAIPEPVAVDPDDTRIRTQAADALDTELAAAETSYRTTLADIDAREGQLDDTVPEADLFARIVAVHHTAFKTTVGTVTLAVLTLMFFLFDCIGLIAKSGMPGGEHAQRLAADEQEAAIASQARLDAIDNPSMRAAAREEAAAKSERDWMDAHLLRKRIQAHGHVDAVLERMRIIRDGRARAEAEGFDLEAYESAVLDLRVDVDQVVPPPPGPSTR